MQSLDGSTAAKRSYLGECAARSCVGDGGDGGATAAAAATGACRKEGVVLSPLVTRKRARVKGHRQRCKGERSPGVQILLFMSLVLDCWVGGLMVSGWVGGSVG